MVQVLLFFNLFLSSRCLFSKFLCSSVGCFQHYCYFQIVLFNMNMLMLGLLISGPKNRIQVHV
ncbi:hypothetical protein M758_2G122900 [Ceratodon purpureus]|nr:hypothetical protein M758_2G122900 [Ceratodon purpureus]